VVEDAACALGASTGGRPAGTWGAIGCYSFHPRKAVTTGEGGVIVTSDDRIASRLRALRNHGQDPESIASEFIMPGFNNRMTEFQGALGVTQMAKIDRVIAARRALAGQYDTLLDPALARCGARPNDERHVFQSYVVLLPEAARQVRAEYIKVLRTRGIEAQIGTWHMPLIQYYRKRYNYSRGDFPVCDAISECAVSLPLYEGLREEDQRIVAIETRAALDAVLSD
jgi:dTDP-4-amino-4,6-dideoxygalactose transaminase